MSSSEVEVPLDGQSATGTLTVPDHPRGFVLFAHGSGSSRMSPRNRFVASVLEQARFATLLLDLLSAAEERVDRVTAGMRFDIPFLARRLLRAIHWLEHGPARGMPLGLFGASTGAAAALLAAARRPDVVRAVVSRGGRPDLAGAELSRVKAPTLLLVGERDEAVADLNAQAIEALAGLKELIIVPGATHLFEEEGALEQVAERARRWFERYLPHRGVSPEASP